MLPYFSMFLLSLVVCSVGVSNSDDAEEVIFDGYLGPKTLSSDDPMFLAGFFSYVGISPMMDFFSERACGIPFESCPDSETTRIPTECAVENLPLLKQGQIDGSTFYVNQGFYVPTIATCSNPVVRPDNGHLYVNVWIDLNNGPVRISYPELRFPSSSGEDPPAVFAVQFLDPFSNNIFHIAPWGNLKATDGQYGQNGSITTEGFYAAQDYYVYWTGMEGREDFLKKSGIPERNLIASDNQLGWMLARVVVKFDDPVPTQELCREFCATAMAWDSVSGTLSELDLTSVQYESNPLPPSESFSVTCGDIDDPIDYLDYAAVSLGQVTWPQGVVNDFYKSMMDSIGVNPDVQGPSNDTRLTDEDLEKIVSGFREAETLLCGSDGSANPPFGEGSPDVPWVNPLSSTGNYGQKLFYRAIVAQQGFGAETNTYEYYPTAKKDSNGDSLISYTTDGGFNEYLVVMDSSIEDVSAMWSLTMYASDSSEKTATVLCTEQNNSCTSEYEVCVTDIGTYHSSWNATDGPILFGDKYLILLSPEPPSSELAQYVNWLPSPNGLDQDGNPTTGEDSYFNITLRVYNAQIMGSNTFPNGWKTPCILPWDRSSQALPTDCSDGLVTGCFGDFNADGAVDGHDLAALFREWGCTGDCIGDLDGDLLVDGLDVALFMNAWGPCPD